MFLKGLLKSALLLALAAGVASGMVPRINDLRETI